MKVGIDLVKVSRFARLIKKADFLQAHFSKDELKYLENKKSTNASQEAAVQTLAGIFCAKEAFLKALGIGIFNGINLCQIEVNHSDSGQPQYSLPQSFFKKYNIKETVLSITHDGGFAAAVCVIS